MRNKVKAGPRAAVFRDGQIIVELENGTETRFPVSVHPRLASATPEQLSKIEISPCGLHWRELDEDLSIKGLMAGNFGQNQRFA